MILLPVFATALLCYTFQDGVIKEAPFGIVDQDNSSLSRMLVKNIAENETFDVKYYSDSPQDLQKQIENNEVVAGVIIPPNFSVDVSAGKSPTVLIIYDGCQMSVVGISKAKLTEVMMTLKAGASIQILEGKLDLQPDEALLYAQPISNTFRYLGNPEKSIGNYILPGAIANIVQLTMYLFMVEAIRREDQERVHPFLYCLLGTILSTGVLLLCVWMMHTIFQIPMNGAWQTIAILGALNMLTVGNIAAMVRLIVPEKTFAAQLAVVVMATLLFSGYTFPALGMPPLFQKLAAILPFTYFALPFRDVLLLGSSTGMIIKDIYWLLCSAVVTAIPVIPIWLWYRFKQLRKMNPNLEPTLTEQEVPPAC